MSLSGRTATPETDFRSVRRKPESYAKLRKAARKLFVERGYHATRPQDIAREAGLGHGTFYLHFADKRACFLAFVEDARTELDAYVRSRTKPSGSLEDFIATMLNAVYEYSQSHSGLLNAAMTDEAVIDAEGVQAVPLLQRWGRDWAEIIRTGARDGLALNMESSIIGANHQFNLGYFVSSIQIPLSRTTMLVIRGGGGPVGFAYGDVGVRALVRGNGGPGTVALTGFAGGASIMVDLCSTNTQSPFTESCNNSSLGGPSLGGAVEWKL